MQNSQLNSLDVPEAGAQNPSTLFKAAGNPIRIVITNTGPTLVLLAHDPGTLTNAPSYANTYRLPAGPGAGSQIVLVLAPNQGVYAVGVGANGTVSIAASEALPIT
jgi:hypothetical protein